MKNPYTFVTEPKDPQYDGLLSNEQIKVHYNHHHLGYVSKALIVKKITSQKELEQEIQENLNNNSSYSNNIQQIYNHNIMWQSLSKEHSGESRLFFNQWNLEEKILNNKLFGSGWLWIVVTKDKKVDVIETSNAHIPENVLKILANIDLWEHAFYIDHQYKKADYMKKYLNYLNYDQMKKDYTKIKV